MLYVVNQEPFYRNDPASTCALQRAIAARPIRQVTVLHDAAAAAIYGALAVNGAVVLSSAKPKKH
jgi:TonB-dependent SusC/RagA subfamily outer membrane receptor